LGAFAQWAGAADADDLRLVRAVTDALTATSTGEQAIVGVDDVHLLDDLSAFVLHQLVVRRAVKVVLTLRDGESVPPAVREIWDAGQFERLDLQPLSQQEAATLVSAALDGPLEADTGRRLWKFTRGNVLYLRNIVEQEVADRRLAKGATDWSWGGDPELPPELAEMIEARFGTLPPALSDVIDTLAVGEPIELGSLTRITDPSAVEAAEIRGLISLDDVDGAVEVRIAHPLYGEIRRKRSAATRLRRLRGLVAVELAAGDTGDDVRTTVRRASLSMESDLPPDPDLLLRAAKAATSLADLNLAERLATAAIRAGAGAEANFIRAHVLGWQSRGEDADAVLAECPTTGFSDDDLAQLAFLRANNLLWTVADPECAKALIDEMESVISPDSRDCIDAFLTVYWATAAKPQVAIEHSDRFELAKLPGVVAGETVSALVGALGAAGRSSDATSTARYGYGAVTDSLDAPYMRMIISELRVGGLVLAGWIPEALEVADQIRRMAADLPGHAQALSTAITGRAALGAGRIGAAIATLKPPVQAFSSAGGTNAIYFHCQPRLTMALAMRGLSDDMSSQFVDLEMRRSPARRFLDWERALARAWVASCRDSATEAIAIVLSAAETAKGNGQFGVEVFCLQLATQFGADTTAARLRELEAIVDGPRVGLAARFAAALGAGNAGELGAISEDFEKMGDLVAAVDASAHAAIAYRRDGHNGTALTYSTRADDLAARCGGVSTPALRKASARVPFTDREYEIVALIGQGLSSRAIAERLTLSVRTVEGHIYRAMAKTGATDRDELARTLPRRSRAT
jgi:DNA-binding CsgD family transcriptional regulator